MVEIDKKIAEIEGLPLCDEWDSYHGDGILVGNGDGDLKPYSPSTNWAQLGPLIEKYKISLYWNSSDGYWVASIGNKVVKDENILIAACKAIIAKGVE